LLAFSFAHRVPSLIMIGFVRFPEFSASLVGNNYTKIGLTPTEFRILQLLSSRKSWVFTRNQILDYLWSDEKYVLDRTVALSVDILDNFVNLDVRKTSF